MIRESYKAFTEKNNQVIMIKKLKVIFELRGVQLEKSK